MPATIGEHLKDTRKRRGLNQRELAQRSGVSLSLIRQLEQGRAENTRLETARKLATALRVPTATLISETSDDDPAGPEIVDHWEPVRRALATPARADDVDEEPTVTGVKEALAATLPLFSSDQFAELATVLPTLIRDADIIAELHPEQGRAVRVRLLQLVGWLLTQTRQFEAAETALDRTMDDANDRLQGAAVVNTRCWLHLRRGRLTEARELAIRWADEVEPRVSRATMGELSAWGWMLLRVSAAAVRDNRPGEAADALRLARSAAIAMGREHAPRNDFLRTFGPVTVALKSAENAMIVDQPDVVLRLAGRVPIGGLRPTSNNRNRHLLDVADAQVRTGRTGDAVETLEKIWHASPQWLPNQRYAKDIMGRLISHRRTLTPQMRELADAIGTPM